MTVQRMMPPSWLHDDAEEDLVGADWHQRAIRTLSDCLNDLASDRNLSWHVGDQLTFVGVMPDGTTWRPSPDIMVHPEAGPATRAEMVMHTDGVPALIVEVASPSTWAYDVDTQGGKAWGYLRLGIPNYLVFDPHGDLMGEQCRGWQQRGTRAAEQRGTRAAEQRGTRAAEQRGTRAAEQREGVAQAWRPEADGRYHALLLDISFQPQGDLLRVFDSGGHPVAYSFEKSRRIRAQEREIRAQKRDLNAQAKRIADLEAELARLRGRS